MESLIQPLGLLAIKDHRNDPGTGMPTGFIFLPSDIRWEERERNMHHENTPASADQEKIKYSVLDARYFSKQVETPSRLPVRTHKLRQVQAT
jgi:hypothetical protein